MFLLHMEEIQKDLSLTELKISLKDLWTLASFLETSVCSHSVTPIQDSICSSALASQQLSEAGTVVELGLCSGSPWQTWELMAGCLP